jgi:cation diffusion facilitator family transporter
MLKDRRQDDVRIRRVTWVGMWINFALTGAKISVGILAGSLGLVADGFHSLSDIATDIAVIFGVYFGGKAPDSQHPYGHGRMETFSAAFVALALLSVGAGMIYKAGLDISKSHLSGETPAVTMSAAVMGIALLSVLSKELLYQWTRRVAVKTHSTALYANAWHHRSDAFSSVAVLVGAIAMRMGYPHGDQLAAIAVGLMIMLVAVQIISGCFHEFAERAVDRKTLSQIEGVLQADARIRQWHQLRTRSAGREIFIDLHILVDPTLNITDAHQIADTLERNLHEQIARPVNVVVHVEPDTPELRK